MSPTVVKKPIKVEPMPVDGEGYNERYCAYLDILGFRRLIDGLKQGDRTFKFLRTLLETLHTPQKGTEKSWHTCFLAQSISDAVAISTLATPDGLIQIFTRLRSWLRIFSKGAISSAAAWSKASLSG
jgi:hypothetical protein